MTLKITSMKSKFLQENDVCRKGKNEQSPYIAKISSKNEILSQWPSSQAFSVPRQITANSLMKESCIE